MYSELKEIIIQRLTIGLQVWVAPCGAEIFREGEKVLYNQTYGLGELVKEVCHEVGARGGRAIYVGWKAGYFSLRQAVHRGKLGFKRD